MAFRLRQFSKVLKIRNSAGQPYILIGGQAVNYWAERYLAVEPELKELQPFTSEDIDFKGTRQDVQHIAHQLAMPAGYPPKVAMTALAGFIPIQIDEAKSVIEVVRRVPGISDSMETPAIKTEWEGETIRVLDPISLLASKLDLAATVSQEKRHDVDHLRILIPCVRSFLREILRQVEIENLPARDWLKIANQAMKLTTSVRASKLSKKHRLSWTEILPLDAIAMSGQAKIRRFREEQLERGFGKSKGISI